MTICEVHSDNGKPGESRGRKATGLRSAFVYGRRVAENV